MALHIDSVRDGLRFSIHPFVRHLLQAANLAPTQVSPNLYKHIVSSLIIWIRVHPDFLFTLKVLLHCYTFKKDPNGWYYISPKSDRGLVAGISNKVPDWKGKWFFMEGDTWEFRDGASIADCVTSVPRSWGGYNKALTQGTTQAKFNDGVKAVLAIHEGDRHFQTLLLEENLD